MSCKPSRFLVITILASFCVVGCSPTRPMYLNDTGDLSYYIEQATEIEYPDVQTASLDEVTQAQRPITVVDPDFQSFYDLTLEQCVAIALQNAKVLRGYGTPGLQGTRVSPGVDGLVNGPAAAGTIFNVAIRESEPGLIGVPGQISGPSQVLSNTNLDVNQGVETALAEFDAQFTTSAFWATNDEPRNVAPVVGNPFDRSVFVQDRVQWQSEIAKKTANGTQIFFRNVNVYTNNNVPLVSDPPPNTGFQNLASWYRTALEVEMRQPLLRGRGAFFQRMPIVISRIGTDQELANLEAQLQNMVTNVEIRYWDLYCGYRNLDAAKIGRDAALKTWRIVYDQFQGGADVDIQQVAQASEQYHFFESQVIDAYNSLLNAESSLRWLMGIASTDGRVIRPIDEAVMAPIEFDWCATLNEALCFRPELRLERWEIKKKELALAYSKNALLPELEVTGLYRWLGLGKNYVSNDNPALNFADPSSGAWNDLYGGDYQEFQLGVDYRMPIGFRRELSNVRNAQLKLVREIARVEDMELDVTRELSETFRALDANRRIMLASFNRWRDTTIEEEHFEEITRLGLETLDVALDAQRRRSQAEIAFYTALCEYNKALALLHRRKGTTLAYNSICFAEGQWPGKAYQDAAENARRRSASRHVNYGWSRPQVISRGPDGPTNANSGTLCNTNIPDQSCALPAEQQSYPPNLEFNSEPVFYDPYYAPNGEFIEGEFINDGVPPLNTEPPTEKLPAPKPSGSSTQNSVPYAVQQVGFDEPIGASQTSRRERKNDLRAVAAPRKPTRESGNRPANRLPKPDQSKTLKAVPATHAGDPGSTESRTVKSNGLNWESFGLTHPDTTPSTTQALIKTDNR